MLSVNINGCHSIKMWISLTVGIFVVFVFDICDGAKTIEMKSNKVTSALPGDTIVIPDTPGRHKRSLFPSDMKQKLVDKHNELRRLEYSSNMELFIWNEYLSYMAEDWAKGCVWEHGQPFRETSELPFPQIGQNLYVYNGTFDPVRGLQLFYDEIEYYDFNTGACSKPPCGHYTQMVWGTSREVGCAFAYCPSMYNIDLINANYLVCNYGPTGNFIGQQPYKKGPSCSGCETGKFWCDDGLCRRDCTRQSTKCECRALCQNCGTVNRNNCTCTCADGWHGDDCSVKCENTHDDCGVLPGWPLSWCNVSYVQEYCPAMCSLCKVSTNPNRDCTTTTTTTTKKPTTRTTTTKIPTTTTTTRRPTTRTTTTKQPTTSRTTTTMRRTTRTTTTTTTSTTTTPPSTTFSIISTAAGLSVSRFQVLLGAIIQVLMIYSILLT